MTKQLNLILYSFSAVMFFSVVANVILPFILFLGVPITLQHAHIINIILVAPVILIMTWRFGLKLIPALVVGYLFSLFWLFYNDRDGAYSFLQKSPLFFFIFITVYPWRTVLSAFLGWVLGKLLQRTKTQAQS